MVCLGKSEEVRDNQQGEGLGVLCDEVAPAVADKLIDLCIGGVPHERLVLLKAFQ